MLHLTAADEGDLAVISAQMQDALARRDDFNFDARRRRFALVANRFAWDGLPAKMRRRAGLHFEDVNSVQSQGFGRAADTIFSLLSVTYEKAAGMTGVITLTFSGAAALRLDVDCINVTLADLGGTWGANMPQHGG